jgi:hypothetical protein
VVNARCEVCGLELKYCPHEPISDDEFVWVLPEGALEELQKRVAAMKANKDK